MKLNIGLHRHENLDISILASIYLFYILDIYTVKNFLSNLFYYNFLNIINKSPLNQN